MKNQTTFTYHHQIFHVRYDSEVSFSQIYDEIFLKEIYQTHLNQENSLIIDGGSNIGLSVLYFKACYPKARIICFEPDPYAFKLLKYNIRQNHLTKVETINAALGNVEGQIPFYGFIESSEGDARGNSILSAWGMQRTISQTVLVDCVKLSSYLNQPIDLLKLDIEGAEEIVLQEIGPFLKNVRQIIIEFHQAKSIAHLNNLEKIQALLLLHNFEVSFTSVNTMDLVDWPSDVRDWFEKEEPKLFFLSASQKEK